MPKHGYMILFFFVKLSDELHDPATELVFILCIADEIAWMQSLTISGLLINYTYNRKYTHICLLVPYLQRGNGHFLKLYIKHHNYFLSNTLQNVLLSEMFADMQLLQLNF